MKKPRQAKVRRRWGVLHPATRVIPDKTRRPYRKRKHKVPPEDIA